MVSRTTSPPTQATGANPDSVVTQTQARERSCYGLGFCWRLLPERHAFILGERPGINAGTLLLKAIYPIRRAEPFDRNAHIL